MWADNMELLSAYYLAADKILELEGRPVSALDISTGPCLAQLMASMHAISDIQMSDFTESNRQQIVVSDIEYWRRYADELYRMFPDRSEPPENLLDRLDALRRSRPPLDVDLGRQPVFKPDVVPCASVPLVTMHFVIDSVCDTSARALEMLRAAIAFVASGGWILMSCLIDSSWWMLGDTREPSPELAEADIESVLEQSGFAVLDRTRSIRKANQTYDGGWTVFLARRRSTC